MSISSSFVMGSGLATTGVMVELEPASAGPAEPLPPFCFVFLFSLYFETEASWKHVAVTTELPVRDRDRLNLVQHQQPKSLKKKFLSTKRKQRTAKNFQRVDTCFSLPVSLVIPAHVSPSLMGESANAATKERNVHGAALLAP